jgi:hypothetical protein
MDSRPLHSDQLSAARRPNATNAEPAERRPLTPRSERKERIFALEDLHKLGILEHDEFAAEMKRVIDLQPTADPTLSELHHQRRRRTWVPRLAGFLAWLPMVAHESWRGGSLGRG